MARSPRMVFCCLCIRLSSFPFVGERTVPAGALATPVKIVRTCPGGSSGLQSLGIQGQSLRTRRSHHQIACCLQSFLQAVRSPVVRSPHC